MQDDRVQLGGPAGRTRRHVSRFGQHSADVGATLHERIQDRQGSSLRDPVSDQRVSELDLPDLHSFQETSDDIDTCADPGVRDAHRHPESLGKCGYIERPSAPLEFVRHVQDKLDRQSELHERLEEHEAGL